MSRRGVFSRDYTSAQLDCGEGMAFHPHTGELLSMLTYDGKTRTFRTIIPGLFLGEDVIELSRIGVGRKRKAGQRYPRTWRFDPFSGNRL
jgi:hypothetical protein